jgi:hypothetical protein
MLKRDAASTGEGKYIGKGKMDANTVQAQFGKIRITAWHFLSPVSPP